MKYYAGIGSRETPENIKFAIERIVNYLNSIDYILRSGGAPGADSFFEEFATQKEIFLPWRGFNNNDSNLFTPTLDAHKMAEKYHPSWFKLSQGAKKLMARNCHQVLGLDLNSPVDFIVCWTRDGKASGGTGQALRIAQDLKIPVYNLYFKDTIHQIFKEIC